MPSVWLTIASVAIFATVCLPAAAGTPRCHGTANVMPPTTSTPRLVATVPNGKKFIAGADDDTFYVVHLWGTPYEMGFAQGLLMKEHFGQFQAMFQDYIDSIINSKLGKKLPAWLIALIEEFGVPLLLDWSYDDTAPFSPASYRDEMQGVADGANISVHFVRRLNMFPELTKAACTIVGANGPATPTSTIQHLRGLDFDPSVPFKDFAQVTVYHGVNGNPTVANFGWTAMIGALTGISDRAIGIGEKVWINHAKGIEGVHGQPWMSILRDVLMTRDMDEALATIQRANKTCAIHVGVGDSTTNTFRGVTMAKDAFTVYNDTSINYTQHPILKGIVYWDRHEQPSHDYCLSDLLKQYYGNITASTLALDVSPISRTGDLHSVTFDYEKLVAFVANARKTNVTVGDLPAYNRRFTRLDLKALFAEKPPSSGL